MIKGITHNERTEFKKTFLKNVQFLISYIPSDMKDKEDMITEKLRNEGFEVKSGDDSFGILGKRNKTAIIVTSKGVTISVDKEDYQGYIHFRKTIEFIASMLVEVGIKECTNLVFQKQNSFKINKVAIQPQYTKERIFQLLFIKKVIDNAPILGIKEGNQIYTVQPLYKDEKDHALAELLISAMYFATVKIDKLVELTDKINDDLYDLWYTSVTDAVRAIMQ